MNHVSDVPVNSIASDERALKFAPPPFRLNENGTSPESNVVSAPVDLQDLESGVDLPLAQSRDEVQRPTEHPIQRRRINV